MSKTIKDSTVDTISALQGKLEDKLKGSTSLEEAAQKFTDLMYDEFEKSIVLVRLFATVPFGELPAYNQEFVNKLADSTGITQLINDKTYILSLLGTHGVEENWNARLNSQGHIGIPLASADFIDSIPMMSRLLKQLGFDLSWIDSKDTEIVTKTMGSMSGVFYVPDAKTTVDAKERKIIAATEFVENYAVKTVFGTGGAYMGGTFITIIAFTRESLEKSLVEPFILVVNYFKTSTMRLVMEGKMFA